MKKKIFGGLLFVVGAAGVLALVVAGVLSPNNWSINGVVTWYSNLKGSGAGWAFCLFLFMWLTGLALCVYEAFKPNIKKLIAQVKAWGSSF
ncbi:MAG: hypothetical protein LBT21_03665 [Oscillospiraceae bacterium]|jgi:hypothetical protein|nr:hypothetical protein [Oscillospiraceae bacterium]